MIKQTSESEINLWTGIIYDPDSLVIREIVSNWDKYRGFFIDSVAQFLYTDIQRTKNLFTSPYIFRKEFNKLTDDEKSDWHMFASEIPKKLRSINLYIRQYTEFCKTCLIPYEDLEKMARTDYVLYLRKHVLTRQVSISDKDYNRKTVSFEDLPDKNKHFFIELNHLIPVALKKIGFEIIRPEEIMEISEKIVTGLAKAIHSRYLNEIRKHDSISGRKGYMSWLFNPGKDEITDFGKLPEEIRHSNLDNAYHIPTKLLSIGYKIRPAEKGFKSASLHLSDEEVETMAKVEHIRWCWDKILHGWFFGKVKDARKKTHPSIIPYEDLPESEKEKDRELIRMIPSLLKDINYEAYPVNPGRIRKLSYSIRPHGSIQRILDEIRELNSQIRSMVSLSDEVEKMVKIRNSKIEDAIREVEGSYSIAKNIQQIYLPDDLYIRECLPESFVLFKPKDIISGDFYFFSRLDNHIIFAAADSTGHGIPGALLSTIGFGILDQAVNEVRLTDPSDILKHLYTKLHKFLWNEVSGNGIRDNMDIALCVLDINTNILTYSGVMNPIYRFTDDVLIEYKAGNLREDYNEEYGYRFLSENIQLKPQDTLYLFSDGYIDQFGGKSRKKYQSTTFKAFLTSIQKYTMTEQSDLLNEEIEAWREESGEDQTDDILVIGIKI